MCASGKARYSKAVGLHQRFDRLNSAKSRHSPAPEPPLATTGHRGTADSAQRHAWGAANREADVRLTAVSVDSRCGSDIGLLKSRTGASDTNRRSLLGVGWSAEVSRSRGRLVQTQKQAATHRRLRRQPMHEHQRRSAVGLHEARTSQDLAATRGGRRQTTAQRAAAARAHQARLRILASSICRLSSLLQCRLNRT